MTDEEKKAIEILDFFEPDDLVECSMYRNALEIIKNLIEKQEKAIDRLAKHIEKFTGSCPLDKCLLKECNKECENQIAECWKEYFMEVKDE